MVPENLNKIKTFIWTNKHVSCFFMREMQHLYITTICWTFLWKISQITPVIANITSWREFYTIWFLNFYKLFTRTGKLKIPRIFFSIFLSLLLFQFFPPGNTKFSTVCKITLLSVFNFYFQIFDFLKISYFGSSLVV